MTLVKDIFNAMVTLIVCFVTSVGILVAVLLPSFICALIFGEMGVPLGLILTYIGFMIWYIITGERDLRKQKEWR